MKEDYITKLAEGIRNLAVSTRKVVTAMDSLMAAYVKVISTEKAAGI